MATSEAVQPNPTDGARLRVMMFLLRKAALGQTTTYEEIAINEGLPVKGNALGAAISPILGDIYRWCEERKLPPITAIVVRKSGGDKGLPGPGFWSLAGRENAPRKLRTELTETYQKQVFDFFIGIV